MVYVGENAPGTEDVDVLNRAGRDRRLLVTEDRDFGQLVYARGRPATAGVLYLRLDGVSMSESVGAVVALLASGIPLSGRFTTLVPPDRIRQRPLPTPRADAAPQRDA